MPTDDERLRIREEELYRRDLQTELSLQHAKATSRPVWAFLNSHFGLWLLSAVVLAGGTTLITRKWEAAASEATRTQLIERADLEIAFRFSRTLAALDSLSASWDAAGAPSAAEKRTVIRALLNQLSSSNAPIATLYPEFAGFSTLALLTELDRAVRDESLHEDLEGVIADLTGIDTRVRVDSIDDTDPVKVASFIQETILGRWRANGFYFTDCSPASPLC